MLKLERLLLYSVVTVLAATVFTSAPADAQAPADATFDTLTVRTIKLVNEEGKLLVHLLPNNAGHGTIALLNTSGKLHTQLTTDANGAGILTTRSKDGVRITSIGAGGQGGEFATFTMAGKLGTLETSLESGGIWSAFTGDTKRVAYVGATNARAGLLALGNQEGQLRAQVACLPDGKGQVAIWDKDGKPAPLVADAAVPKQPGK